MYLNYERFCMKKAFYNLLLLTSFLFTNRTTEIGKLINKALQKDPKNKEFFYIYHMLHHLNRYEEQKSIWQYLSQGYIVILDRCNICNLVYAECNGVDVELIQTWLTPIERLIEVQKDFIF